MQDLEQILNKKFSYIKVPRDIVYRLLDEGRDAELILFLYDTVVQEIKGRKFATRTMVDKIRNATISKSSVALYRKEKVEFEEAFQEHTNKYKKYRKTPSKPKPKPTSAPKAEPTPPPTPKQPTPKPKKRTTNTKYSEDKDEPMSISNRIKNNILNSHLLNVLRTNYEYVKRYIVDIMNSQESFDMFALEFYDFLYPNKKISSIRKIWYVSSFKDKILNKDYRTIENIKNFYEHKDMHLAYIHIQNQNRQQNMV